MEHRSVDARKAFAISVTVAAPNVQRAGRRITPARCRAVC